MNSIFDQYKGAPSVHLADRLRALSQHRTPAAMNGIVRPADPVPINDWLLLQACATRIERLEEDLATYRKNVNNCPDGWKWWAIVNDNNRVMDVTKYGKACALQVLDCFIADNPRARAWTIRPMLIGGVDWSEGDVEDELSPKEKEAAR